MISKIESVKMASNSKYPPDDLTDRRNQTNYRIQHELNVLSKRMNQTRLDSAAKQASDKEREKCKGENLFKEHEKRLTDSRAIEAGERERARLVAEERERLMRRGQLNIPTREKFIPSLEEKTKNLNWKQMNEQKQRRMLELDRHAAEATNKELGPSYRMSPSLLRMNKKY